MSERAPDAGRPGGAITKAAQDRHTAWKTIAYLWSYLSPFVGLGVAIVIFAVIYPRCYPFVHEHLPENLRLNVPTGKFLSEVRVNFIAIQSAIVAMGALGMTVVIISGGIDLSVGSLMALASVCLATFLKAGMNPLLAVALTLLVGLIAGVLNGVLITSLRLVPFIVTLGTMLIFRGAAHLISAQKKVAAPAPVWMQTLMDTPAQGSKQLLSTGCWLVVLLGIVVALILRYTVFGRHVYALGSNEATARLCGVNVPLTKIAVYAVGGLFMGIAGLCEFSVMNSQGDPTDGIGLELNIIAAVVIGGGSLSGGRGSILGAILGALTMTTLQSGCTYVGLSDPIQKAVIGSIIIVAVAIDQYLHRGRNA